jgi:hypothetical protein
MEVDCHESDYRKDQGIRDLKHLQKEKMTKPLLIDYPIDEVSKAFQSSQDKRE